MTTGIQFAQARGQLGPVFSYLSSPSIQHKGVRVLRSSLPPIMLATICSVALTACGEDPGDGPSPIPPSPSTNNSTMDKEDMGMMTSPEDMDEDTPDLGEDLDMNTSTGNNNPSNTTPNAAPNAATNTMMGPDMGACDPEADMECLPFVTYGECTQVIDEGVLQPGVYNLEGSTFGLSSVISTSCSQDADAVAEYVWSFETTTASFVTATITEDNNTDWVLSVREGDCEPTGERLCRDSGLVDYLTTEGQRQFIIAEPRVGTSAGELEIQIEIESAVCTDTDQRACVMDDNIQVCEGGTSLVNYACGSPCANDQCAGDTCANAIALMQDGSYSYQGDLRAYDGVFDAMDYDSCKAIAGTTPGNEVIFSLPGLKSGQTIAINADGAMDQNDNAIFVLGASCSQGVECLAGDELLDSMQYTVPADGDYHVVIDSISRVSKPFDYTIEVLP